jgi:hypothetical protein
LSPERLSPRSTDESNRRRIVRESKFSRPERRHSRTAGHGRTRPLKPARHVAKTPKDHTPSVIPACQVLLDRITRPSYSFKHINSLANSLAINLTCYLAASVPLCLPPASR